MNINSRLLIIFMGSPFTSVTSHNQELKKLITIVETLWRSYEKVCSRASCKIANILTERQPKAV